MRRSRLLLPAAAVCVVAVRALSAFAPAPMSEPVQLLWWTLAVGAFPLVGIAIGRGWVEPFVAAHPERRTALVLSFLLAGLPLAATYRANQPFYAAEGRLTAGWNFELFLLGFDLLLLVIFSIAASGLSIAVRRATSLQQKFLAVGLSSLVVTIAIEHLAPRLGVLPADAGTPAFYVVLGIIVSTIVYGFCTSFAGEMTRWFEQSSGALEAFGRGNLDVGLDESPLDETGALARTFNTAVRSRREAQFVERAFGRYVAPAVLDALRNNRGGLTLESRRLEATVLYADIRGFTRFSESESPEEVMRVLNVYFARMIGVIGEHGGYINKFIGDAVMVVFGAPVEQADHAARGVACGIAMQGALAAMNESSAFGAARVVEIGIGVNTGPLVAGSLGSDARAEYTVIGDTVNVAARLTSAAKPGDVLVGAATARASGYSALEPQPPLTVKGKSQPLDVFRAVPLAAARA